LDRRYEPVLVNSKTTYDGVSFSESDQRQSLVVARVIDDRLSPTLRFSEQLLTPHAERIVNQDHSATGG
jgi:hypothetical protein